MNKAEKFRYDTIYKPNYEAFISLYDFGLEDLSGEQWQAIPYCRDYHISNYGCIKSFHKGKVVILKPRLQSGGYLTVAICKNGENKTCSVHRLVAEAFIPNLDGLPQVNHKDGCKFNNHVDNLEWCTQSENQQHAVRMGLKTIPQGEDSPCSHLTNEQAIWCRGFGSQTR